MTQYTETEIVVYAELTHLPGLALAAHYEHHLQAERRSPTERVRVRRTRTPTHTAYSQTLKKHIAADDGITACEEHTTAITRDAFAAFFTTCETYMEKTRYCFTTKNPHVTFDTLTGPLVCTVLQLYYEVDVFPNADGELHPWCKIDIEIDTLLRYLERQHPDAGPMVFQVRVAHLPCAPRHAFIEANATAEQKAWVSTLYNTVFFKPITPAVLENL